MRFPTKANILGGWIVIKSRIVWNGKLYKLTYTDEHSFDNLPYDQCQQVYGVCFYDDQIVVVKNKENEWTLVGGTIEHGETYLETLRREVEEEANMKI